jgi:hypothetical protein
MNEYIYCPNLVKIDVRHFNIMPFRIFEFRENWRRGDLTFVLGVHGVTFSVYDEPVWYFESKEQLGKVFVLRHGVPSCFTEKVRVLTFTTSSFVNTDNSIQIQIIQSL